MLPLIVCLSASAPFRFASVGLNEDCAQGPVCRDNVQSPSLSSLIVRREKIKNRKVTWESLKLKSFVCSMKWTLLEPCPSSLATQRSLVCYTDGLLSLALRKAYGPLLASGACLICAWGRPEAHRSSLEPMTKRSWWINTSAVLPIVGGTSMRRVLHNLTEVPSGMENSSCPQM